MASRRSEEFRHKAVRLALTSGLTRTQVAANLGIGLSALP
jgi:transposase